MHAWRSGGEFYSGGIDPFLLYSGPGATTRFVLTPVLCVTIQNCVYVLVPFHLHLEVALGSALRLTGVMSLIETLYDSSCHRAGPRPRNDVPGRDRGGESILYFDPIVIRPWHV